MAWRTAAGRPAPERQQLHPVWSLSGRVAAEHTRITRVLFSCECRSLLTSSGIPARTSAGTSKRLKYLGAAPQRDRLCPGPGTVATHLRFVVRRIICCFSSSTLRR